MTKKIFFGLAFAALLTACTDDYKDWVSPEKVAQPEQVSFADGSVSAVDVIKMADLVDGQTMVKVCNLTAPTASVSGYTPIYSISLNGQEFALEEDGTMFVNELKEYVEKTFGKAPKQREIEATVSAWLNDGNTSVKTATSAAFPVKVLLDAPFIDSGYWLVGDMLGWDAAGAKPFTHKGSGDVYEAPEFQIVFKTTADNQYWKIIPQGNYDGDFWGGGNKGVLGTVVDGDTSMEGTLTTDNPQAGKIEKAGTYRMTINMMEYTYKIDPIIVADAYYVVGGVQGWSDSKKICLFTPEEQKDVLSYTTKWTGAWDLKVWDANSFGNWDAAWGCVVDGDNSPSGALINSGAGAISAPSAEFYTFTIDMNTMTYTWTKLANQNPTEYEHISLIGEFNGWSGDVELEQVTPHNWYGVFTQETDGQLKFRANHDWGTNWGYGNDRDWDVSENFNKIGTNGGGNIWVPAGTYAVYLNDITNSMLILAQ